MKSLQTIIKLHTRELDEMRKTVVQHEQEKDRLIEYNNKMEDELAQEHIIASKDLTMSVMFVNYRNVIRERQDVIEKSLLDLDNRIAVLKENITVKFGEVKKYEILLASKIKEQLKQEKARETKELDAIAVGNFLKEQEEV